MALSLLLLSLYNDGSSFGNKVSRLAVLMAFRDDNDGLVFLATIPREKRMALFQYNDS